MIDTQTKRMSALLTALPFRSGMLNPADTGFGQGNRQAAAFSYSGILAGEFVEVEVGNYSNRVSIQVGMGL